MKVKNVKFANRKDTVYDFETPSHTYILSNGLVSHNTQEMYSKTVVSGGCVLKGTLIQTPEGLKPVEQFQIGDKVVTMSGEHTVTHVWDPDTLEEGTPECFEIEFDDGFVVTCSDKHKFLVNGVWVEAKNLQENDDVFVNKVS